MPLNKHKASNLSKTLNPETCLYERLMNMAISEFT